MNVFKPRIFSGYLKKQCGIVTRLSEVIKLIRVFLVSFGPYVTFVEFQVNMYIYIYIGFFSTT